MTPLLTELNGKACYLNPRFACRGGYRALRRNGFAVNGLARDILTRPGIEGDPLSFLKVTEAYWKALQQSKHEPHKPGPTVIRQNSGQIQQLDYDVLICGGVLGLFVGTTLQQRGYKVCIVDKRLVQGRSQEWNISRRELEVLLELRLLTPAELEAVVVSEFNPIRVGFKGAPEIWTRDVLNLGVSPKLLLDFVKEKFLAAGGVIQENTAFKTAELLSNGLEVTLVAGGRSAPVAVGDVNRPNGLCRQDNTTAATSHSKLEPAAVNMATPSSSTIPANSSSMHSSQGGSDGTSGSRSGSSSGSGTTTTNSANSSGSSGSSSSSSAKKSTVRCRLLLDCMGHYSDIVKQIRGHTKPDGMVIVVGACAEGFPASANSSADLLYTFTEAFNDMQLFWEAFPAEGGSARTTYMFTYTDAHPSRPSFEQLLDTYFKLLPQYQDVSLDNLKFKRVLFGGFPCYSNGPLRPGFDRILQIGDASATQSPLSFGGFGCMMRHLKRLTEALSQALDQDRLSKSDLAWLHPYQPSLSASWLFQRSMSVGVGQLRQVEDLDKQHADVAAVQWQQQPGRLQQQRQQLQQRHAALHQLNAELSMQPAQQQQQQPPVPQQRPEPLAAAAAVEHWMQHVEQVAEAAGQTRQQQQQQQQQRRAGPQQQRPQLQNNAVPADQQEMQAVPVNGSQRMLEAVSAVGGSSSSSMHDAGQQHMGTLRSAGGSSSSSSSSGWADKSGRATAKSLNVVEHAAVVSSSNGSSSSCESSPGVWTGKTGSIGSSGGSGGSIDSSNGGSIADSNAVHAPGHMGGNNTTATPGNAASAHSSHVSSSTLSPAASGATFQSQPTSQPSMAQATSTPAALRTAFAQSSSIPPSSFPSPASASSASFPASSINSSALNAPTTDNGAATKTTPAPSPLLQAATLHKQVQASTTSPAPVSSSAPAPAPAPSSLTSSATEAPSAAAAAAATSAESSPQQSQPSQPSNPPQRKAPCQHQPDPPSSLPNWAKLPPNHVNQVLACNFAVEKVLGDWALRPFLCDTIQFVPLSLTMLGMMLHRPLAITRVLTQVGPKVLFGWFAHYVMLGVYTCLHTLLHPLKALFKRNFYAQRFFDALEYGSGNDFKYHPPSKAAEPQQQQQQQQQWQAYQPSPAT